MNKENSNNNSNEGQPGRPNVFGTDPKDINARLNRIYGNLQTAASPSEVRVLRRPWRPFMPPLTELEIEEQRRLNEQWRFPQPGAPNNSLEDSKDNDKENKKEEDNANGSGSGSSKKVAEKIKKKVRFVGVPCICSDCGNSHISGDNAETGQDQASTSVKNRELTWEELRDLPLPDDKDEGL